MSEKEAVRAGRGFTLFIQNEDLNDVIKMIVSLNDSGTLIDGANKTAKHYILNE